LLFEEVCTYCGNQTFCEEYGDGDCEALNILRYLLERGKITKDDIKEYREKLKERFLGGDSNAGKMDD